jgi:arylsulfatase A
MNTSRPNIVLILIDDLGWKDLACTGSRYYQTPHIDQLASEGVLFTRAYAAAPICSPSRGALYSGQYPARSKFTAVIRPYVEPDADLHEMSKPVQGNVQFDEAPHRHCLPPDVPTIAELLVGTEYHTGFVGKWHCGWNEAHWPDQRGWMLPRVFARSPPRRPGISVATSSRSNAKTSTTSPTTTT